LIQQLSRLIVRWAADYGCEAGPYREPEDCGAGVYLNLETKRHAAKQVQARIMQGAEHLALHFANPARLVSRPTSAAPSQISASLLTYL